MSKQDRQGVRTAADLERKYNFERLNKSTNQAMNISAETREAISKLSQDFRKELDTKLDGYVEEADLEDYAQKSDLNNYAKKADLNGYAKATDLANYATTTALAGVKTDVSKNTQAIAGMEADVQNAKSKSDVAYDMAQGVSNDVNDHLEFADGGTRIKGIFHALLLPAGTDLDGVILPNKYIGGNVAQNKYLHCPITTGTFFLSVEYCGDQGQLLQRLTYSHKTDGKTYERVYTDDWGAWICVADYTGEALNAVQNEVNALEIALSQYMTSAAASTAETEGDIVAITASVNALSGRTQKVEQSVQVVAADLQGVINDVNDHFEFVEGGMSIKGGIMPLVLPPETDLDGIMIPKKYASGNVEDSNYGNCPVTSGTFSLEVESCGNEGQLLQRLTYSHKTNGKTFERVFYLGEWGEWIVVSDYTGAALKAIQNDMGSLEDALDQYKSDSNTRMTKVEGNISTISNNVGALTNSTQTINTKLQAVTTDLQGVINDINDHFDFNEGGMTIRGAINPMLIPAGTDLDGLTIPNKYIGGVVTEYKYLNCPVTSGTFILEVDSCGIEGQLRQRITYCHKTNSKTWERFSYGVDWGAWVLTADHAAETVADLRADVEADLNTLGANLNSLGAELDAVANRIDNLSVQNFLWSGQNYMTATQTVNLSGKVSEQRSGIVLVFCEYINGAAATSAFHSFFIPKAQVVSNPGKGYTFTLATGKFEYMATKYLYIDDEKIDGHADNNTTGTGTSGIKYTNNRFVLRYVIGI